ncbi:hypothetical protein M408DRAFT_73800 [Serendipita vermifera MAFF 305830]|uniref:Uncharacterized protein n=1 Tax=Serendipita vermifera MAFF 305830 TaxID=933852 RepID=A0A0C3AMJ5_SERVB|nr:hypothetical protein M408DRAFT_73800 [Serendipita vermifera MAFF 305830]
MSGTGSSRSMRENYNTHGVENYYNLVSSTYRNPHFIPVKHCLFDWMNAWWTNECHNLDTEEGSDRKTVKIFDLACGLYLLKLPFHSGEVTESIASWLDTARRNSIPQSAKVQDALPVKRRIPWQQSPPPIPFEDLSLLSCAADPYTAAAYKSRLNFSCAELSFQDVADGALPLKFLEISLVNNPTADSLDDSTSTKNEDLGIMIQSDEILDMVVCSFALHLIETPSQLFSLLWELSQKARWLVVIAPHKKPEIKDGWGWVQWNIGQWELCGSRGPGLGSEILQDRVHLRAFKSVNFC